jgi:hypothetical protein
MKKTQESGDSSGPLLQKDRFFPSEIEVSDAPEGTFV